MKQRFLPTTDSGRDLWAKNFAAKLPQYASKYGITAAELADVQLSVLNYSYWLNFKNQMDELNKKSTQYKNEVADGFLQGNTISIPPVFPAIGAPPAPVAPGVFIRIASIAQRIKKHLNYTVPDGKDLGIEVVTTSSIDVTSVQPELSIRLIEAGKPEIIWHKKGMSAIELYVDRGQGFEFLAFDTTPNYIDEFVIETGQTAVWKYKGVYLLNDKRVGQFSDVKQVTVTGPQ